MFCIGTVLCVFRIQPPYDFQVFPREASVLKSPEPKRECGHEESVWMASRLVATPAMAIGTGVSTGVSCCVGPPCEGPGCCHY